jgi:hypothetical protein
MACVVTIVRTWLLQFHIKSELCAFCANCDDFINTHVVETVDCKYNIAKIIFKTSFFSYATSTTHVQNTIVSVFFPLRHTNISK